MDRRFMTDSAVEKQSQKIWPQIITLLLGLTVFAYTVWTQANPWFLIIPAVIVVIVLIMLLRDSGVFAWLGEKRSAAKANKAARKNYPRFIKMLKRAQIHQELLKEMRNIEWKITVPQYTYTNFEIWYGEIMRKAENLKVSRSIELELLGDRFHDLLSFMNNYYLRPLSEDLRSGNAKYQNEQKMKIAHTAKDAYDRFLESYDTFCDEINEIAGQRVLNSIYGTSPVIDWDAATPEVEKSPL